MSLMKEIEKARIRLGVTASAVACRAGVHETTYTKARSGANKASPETLASFLAALEDIQRERENLSARAKTIASTPKQRSAA